MADTEVPVLYAVAVPTFIGSLLSCIATLAALTAHFFRPPSQHYRHALIINLLLADFMNSLNNTVSGAAILARKKTGSPATEATASCIANAWIGQFTVQAIDFTILIIAISVLHIVYTKQPSRQHSLRTSVLVCAVAWIPGLITSNVALGMNVYGHVSGNWCWILPEYLGYRYGLTHGWRIAIFIATIIIYSIVYFRLNHAFKRLRMSSLYTSRTGGTNPRSNIDQSNRRGWTMMNEPVGHELEEQHSMADLHRPEPKAKFVLTSDSTSANETPSIDTHPREAGTGTQTNISAGGHGHSAVPAPPNLKKMLLLNGYPIAYIILWIPGMANRLYESITGSSPLWLRALQSSTQYVGLVNALTYGINEQVRRAFRQWWKGLKLRK